MSRFVRSGVVFWWLVLAAVVGGVAFAGVYVWQKHQWATERLAEIEPRHARLAGMKQRQDELAEQGVQAKKRLEELVYPAGIEVVAAGNDAQQRVRQVLTAAGLSLVSSQTLEPKVEGAFDRVPLSVRVDGDLLALQTALNALDTLRPVIWIDGMSVQSTGSPPDRPTRLNVSFNLSVLRGRP